MKYCKECGHQAEDDAQFCNNCGTKFDSDDNNQNDEQTTPAEETPKNNTNQQDEAPTSGTEEEKSVSSGLGGGSNSNGSVSKMTKKTKILIGSIVAIIVILIVAFKVGESMNSPVKTAEKFKEALNDEDTAEINKLLKADHDDLEIDDDSIDAMLEYLDDNKDVKDEVTEHLDNQADRLDKDGSSDGDESRYSSNSFNLKKDGKFLIFDKYKVAVSPVYFKVSSNYEGTEIFVNDDSVAKMKKDYDSKKVGPFLPGKYEFKAKYKSDVADLETKKTEDNFRQKYSKNVSLNIRGESVTFSLPFYSKLDELNLVINGKNTKHNLVEESTVKPMQTGKDVKAQYVGKFPWGEMKSTEFVVDSSYPNQGFQVDEKLQKKLKERIIQSEKEQIEALTSGGKKLPKNMDKKTVENLEKQAKRDKKSGIKYKLEYLGSDFDKSSYTLDNKSDEWVIEVRTTLYRKEQKEYKSGVGKDSFKKNESTKTYQFIYDEKAKDWNIIGTKGYGAPRSGEIDEHREKDPKTYKTK